MLAQVSVTVQGITYPATTLVHNAARDIVGNLKRECWLPVLN
jgi:hypothetical protein